jgi:lactate permease
VGRKAAPAVGRTYALSSPPHPVHCARRAPGRRRKGRHNDGGVRVPRARIASVELLRFRVLRRKGAAPTSDLNAPLWAVALALVPLAVLPVLILKLRAPVGSTAWASVVVAVLLALWPFRLEAAGLQAGALKGLWTGAWIALIVVPALLLYEVAEHSGALERLTAEMEHLAPTPARRLLLLAWAFPAFVQGATGFGSPLAVAAPMLVRTGLTPVEAVAACLIGYHWSIAFGSMGSSYFIAVGTAGLDSGAAVEFAVRTACLLAVTCLAGAALLLHRAPRGRRMEAVPPAAMMGAAMTAVLVVTAWVQPALASILAGLAGLAVGMWALPHPGASLDRGLVVRAASPYLLLALMVGIAFGVGPVREAFDEVPRAAPAFAESRAAYGHVNPAIDALTPFRPLLHPFPYLVASAAIGVWLYRRSGWWRAGAGRAVISSWLKRVAPTTFSILGLTTLAGVMVEAGMVAAIAGALTTAFGAAYAGLSALLGMGGTILAGNTSASNALLAPLQAEAAARVGIDPPVFIAAQAAGGNVGNILSPVNILVGAVVAGCAGREGDVIRRNLKGAGLLLALVTAGTLAQAFVLGGA